MNNTAPEQTLRISGTRRPATAIASGVMPKQYQQGILRFGCDGSDEFDHHVMAPGPPPLA